MFVGVVETDARHAEGGAGEPETFVVEVYMVSMRVRIMIEVLTVHDDGETLVLFAEKV